jgi:hypothetical protein
MSSFAISELGKLQNPLKNRKNVLEGLLSHQKIPSFSTIQKHVKATSAIIPLSHDFNIWKFRENSDVLFGQVFDQVGN